MALFTKILQTVLPRMASVAVNSVVESVSTVACAGSPLTPLLSLIELSHPRILSYKGLERVQITPAGPPSQVANDCGRETPGRADQRNEPCFVLLGSLWLDAWAWEPRSIERLSGLVQSYTLDVVAVSIVLRASCWLL